MLTIKLYDALVFQLSLRPENLRTLLLTRINIKLSRIDLK